MRSISLILSPSFPVARDIRSEESSVISEPRRLVTRRVNISPEMTFSAYRWLAVADNVTSELSTR